MHTAEFLKIHSKIEKEFEKTLAYLSDAQMGSNREKIKIKNLVTCTLPFRSKLAPIKKIVSNKFVVF